MNRKTRSVLQAAAVLVVLLAVLMELGILFIPALLSLKFWMVVAAFGIMLIVGR